MATYDLTDVPSNDLKPGRYVVEVADIDLVPGKVAEQIEIRLRPVAHANRMITDWLSLSPKAAWRLKEVLVALDGPFTIDTERIDELREGLVGRRCSVLLTELQDGPSAGYLRPKAYRRWTEEEERAAKSDPPPF